MTRTLNLNATMAEAQGVMEAHWAHSPHAASAQRGWDSWGDAHRASLPMAVALTGARSLYELGCGAGQNLRLLREKCPSLELAGADIRQEYVDWCLAHGFAAEVASLPKKVRGYEATLSCYTMAYVDPETVTEQLRAIESPYLILMEPNGLGDCQMFIRDDGTAVIPRWYHNWKHLLRATGWDVLWRWPVETADDLKTLVIAHR